MKRVFNEKTVVGFVFTVFACSSVYLVVLLTRSASDPQPGGYGFVLVKCVAGMVAVFIPALLRRWARLEIPSVLVIIYACFLFCGVFLAEVCFFYVLIPSWDTVLHGLSGLGLAALAIALTGLTNKSGSLRPGFAAFFAFCFATASGAVWEIYEYVFDTAANLNMQEYMAGGEPLVGHAALVDTMTDLIADAAGALAMSVISYVVMRRDDGWLGRMQIRVEGRSYSSS